MGHDWRVLELLHSTLNSYYAATMCSQGNENHIGMWFPTLDYVFSRTWDFYCNFRDLRIEYPDLPEYEWLEGAAYSAWLKCEKYYRQADESPVYYAADVLQPHRKWGWYNEEWTGNDEKEPWLKEAKTAVQQLWEEEYKGKFSTQKETITLVSRPKRPDDEFAALSEHRRIKNTVSSKPTNIDAFQTYLECDRIPEGNDEALLEYWNSRIASQPDLAHFALDMLALPISSAECERIFSSAKLLITPSRSRLKSDIIEANECLRAWFAAEEEKKKKEEEKKKKKAEEEGKVLVDQNEDESWGEFRLNEDEDGESDQEAEKSDEESE